MIVNQYSNINGNIYLEEWELIYRVDIFNTDLFICNLSYLSFSRKAVL